MHLLLMPQNPRRREICALTVLQFFCGFVNVSLKFLELILHGCPIFVNIEVSGHFGSGQALKAFGNSIQKYHVTISAWSTGDSVSTGLYRIWPLVWAPNLSLVIVFLMEADFLRFLATSFDSTSFVRSPHKCISLSIRRVFVSNWEIGVAWALNCVVAKATFHRALFRFGCSWRDLCFFFPHLSRKFQPVRVKKGWLYSLDSPKDLIPKACKFPKW